MKVLVAGWSNTFSGKAHWDNGERAMDPLKDHKGFLHKGFSRAGTMALCMEQLLMCIL